MGRNPAAGSNALMRMREWRYVLALAVVLAVLTRATLEAGSRWGFAGLAIAFVVSVLAFSIVVRRAASSYADQASRRGEDDTDARAVR